MMNTKLFFIAVAIVATFSIAVAVAGPLTITAPAMAQNITGDNATTMAGNVTAANQTAGNWTK
jgi:ABC-type enterobactin transport system permease subunit